MDDVTVLCLRVARENRAEQGPVCLLPRQTASTWVAFLIQKVSHKILFEVKDRSDFAAFFVLIEKWGQSACCKGRDRLSS